MDRWRAGRAVSNRPTSHVGDKARLVQARLAKRAWTGRALQFCALSRSGFWPECSCARRQPRRYFFSPLDVWPSPSAQARLPRLHPPGSGASHMRARCAPSAPTSTRVGRLPHARSIKRASFGRASPAGHARRAPIRARLLSLVRFKRATFKRAFPSAFPPGAHLHRHASFGAPCHRGTFLLARLVGALRFPCIFRRCPITRFQLPQSSQTHRPQVQVSEVSNPPYTSQPFCCWAPPWPAF